MIFLSILALIVIYLLFIYRKFKSVLKNAKLNYIKHSTITLGTGRALNYIAGGDSTALGVGATSFKNTYTYRLAEYLAIKNQVSYRNIAASGAISAEVITMQVPEIIKAKPDVVTISVGANDVVHGISGYRILKNIQAIIEILTQKTQAKIYITDIPGFKNASLLPFFYREYIDFKARRLNRIIKSMESERVKIVDIHDFGWASYPDIRITFAADNFHPGDEGYNNWTNAFLSRIKSDF